MVVQVGFAFEGMSRRLERSVRLAREAIVSWLVQSVISTDIRKVVILPGRRRSEAQSRRGRTEMSKMTYKADIDFDVFSDVINILTGRLLYRTRQS